jgi:hypothetical protein
MLQHIQFNQNTKMEDIQRNPLLVDQSSQKPCFEQGTLFSGNFPVHPVPEASNLFISCWENILFWELWIGTLKWLGGRNQPTTAVLGQTDENLTKLTYK